MKKTAVIYFSQTTGNTKRIAKKIAEALKGDLYRIETIEPYPEDYQTVVNQGQNEVNCGFIPKIKKINVDLNDYDQIVIGSPTWWYTMAPAVKAFIESQDWRNKNVTVFTTHGGWPAHALKDIENLCMGAHLGKGMAIQFDNTGGSKLVMDENEIDTWIQKLI